MQYQKLFHNHLALLLLENEHVKINETSSQVKNYFGNIYSCDQLTVINPSPVLLDPTGLPIKGSPPICALGGNLGEIWGKSRGNLGGGVHAGGLKL